MLLSRARIRAWAQALAVLLVATTALLGTPEDATAAESAVVSRTTGQVTADALPTTQVDGVVWDQAVAGGRVFAGGQFTAARPAGAAPGAQEAPRGNLLAYDLATGVLDDGFRPSLNGVVNVLALSPDKSRLYVGGSFTTADGQSRDRIAAYSVATGQLVASFSPSLDGTVKAIAVTNNRVYVGGLFSRANGNARGRLAAFDLNGTLVGWQPRANAAVNALLVTPDGGKLLAAGAFSTITSLAATGLAALDLRTGALLPWAADSVVRDSGTKAAMLSLKTDGRTIYGSGYSFEGAGNFEGAWAADPDTGAITWLADCHGDTYDVAPLGGAVYAAGHHHTCSNIGGFPEQSPRQHQRATAFTAAATGTVRHNTQSGYADFADQGAPSQINWFPDLKAGSFTGQTQAAWTAEASGDYLVLGGEFPEVNGVAQQGLVRFAVPDKAPTKQGGQVSRAESAPTLLALSATAVRVAWKSNWDRDDDQLTYEVRRSGESTPVHTTTEQSLWWQRRTLSFVDSGLSPGTTYTYTVRASDRDGNYANSSSVSVKTGAGSGGQNAYAQAVLEDGATNYWRLGEPAGGTLAPDFAGTTDLRLGTGAVFGAAGAVAASPDGAATFSGTAPAAAATRTAVRGPTTFSAEAWVKTTSTRGGKIIGFGSAATGNSLTYDRHLYLDDAGRVSFGVYPGQVKTVRSRATVNDGQWHHVVGTLSSAGMVLYLDGVLVGSDASVRTAQSYAGYWRVGGDTTKGWPGAGTSGYLDGTIDDAAVYGTALSAEVVQRHDSAARTAAPRNEAPVARFGRDCTRAVCAFDGSASTDPDGDVSSYAWDFGDDRSGTGVSPTHTYAASGTYPVRLTVTDDDGTTDTTSAEVVVDDQVLVADAFDRTLSSGWGKADAGGAWSLTPSSRFATDGAGTITLGTPGAGATATLPSVSATDLEVVSELSVDKAPTAGTYATFILRKQTAADYRIKVLFRPNGEVALATTRVVAGAETLIRQVTVPGVSYTPGDVLHVRAGLAGKGPTTITAKVWVDSSEPSTAQLTTTDSTAALQAPGSFALQGYLGSTATNAPVRVSVDDLRVVGE